MLTTLRAVCLSCVKTSNTFDNDRSNITTTAEISESCVDFVNNEEQ